MIGFIGMLISSGYAKEKDIATILIEGSINSQKGFTGEGFEYRAVYTNETGIMPADGFPKVHILYKKGEEIVETEGSPFKMEQASIWDRNCKDGKEYKYKYNFKIPLRQYYYYFEAMAEGAMERKGSPIKEGPVVNSILAYRGASFPGMSWSSIDIGDINNDGFMDIIIMGEEEMNPKTRLYKNENGTFVNKDYNLANLSEGSVLFFDANNDGLLDIFITGVLDKEKSVSILKLYINDGEMFFDSGQEFKDMLKPTAKVIDYNNDGWMDVIVMGIVEAERKYVYRPIARFYKNDKGKFSEIKLDLPVLFYPIITCADYNKDGFCDLFISGMDENKQLISRLYKNNKDGNFSDSGLKIPVVVDGAILFFDYNNDGWLDLLVVGGSGYGQEPVFGLYRNQGGELVEEKTGIEGLNMAGASVGDYDNDGWFDLALMGIGTSTSFVVYRNEKGRFLSSKIGFPPASHGNLRWFDMENDGDLDIFIEATMKKTEHTWATEGRIYENDTSLGRSNIHPLPPKSFEATYSTDTLTLRWGKGEDRETPVDGLSYNIRVGTQTGGVNILSQARPLGDYIHNNFVILKVPKQKYYWSVQTIDSGFANSEWSKEQVFMPVKKER
jgi:hypothetical protein